MVVVIWTMFMGRMKAFRINIWTNECEDNQTQSTTHMPLIINLDDISDFLKVDKW